MLKTDVVIQSSRMNESGQTFRVQRAFMRQYLAVYQRFKIFINVEMDISALGGLIISQGLFGQLLVLF